MHFFKSRQQPPQERPGPCPPYEYRAARTPLTRRVSAICAVIEHNRDVRRWMREYRPSRFDVRALVRRQWMCKGLLHTPMSQEEADYRKWHERYRFEGRGGLRGGLSGIVGARL